MAGRTEDRWHDPFTTVSCSPFAQAPAAAAATAACFYDRKKKPRNETIRFSRALPRHLHRYSSQTFARRRIRTPTLSLLYSVYMHSERAREYFAKYKTYLLMYKSSIVVAPRAVRAHRMTHARAPVRIFIQLPCPFTVFFFYSFSLTCSSTRNESDVKKKKKNTRRRTWVSKLRRPLFLLRY